MTINISEEQIKRAAEGDRNTLEELIDAIRAPIFNLSLRMLGFVHDAEDATQEILVKIASALGSFRGQSKFSTWVYRIAVNYLIDYKKSPFYERPLSFEFYGNDIRNAAADSVQAEIDSEERDALARELKLSCTNVMLQCLDAESRSLFILGSMFRINSAAASEIFDISPENFRQRLSRIRKNVAAFLASNCGLAGGVCSCSRRVGYALKQGRIRQGKYDFSRLTPLETELAEEYAEELEKLDELSLTFDDAPKYNSTVTAREIMAAVMDTPSFRKIVEFNAEND